MRTRSRRRRLLPPVLVLAFLAAACEGSGPTAPEALSDSELGSLLEVPGAPDDLLRPVSPTLLDLLGVALRAVEREHGREAALALADRVKRARERLAEARRAGDPDAWAAAARALEAEAAEIVIRALGREAFLRVLARGEHGLRELADRLDAWEAAGRDVERVRRLAAEIERLLAAARAEASAGRPVPALIAAARALDELDRLRAGLSTRTSTAGAPALQRMFASAVARVRADQGAAAAEALLAGAHAIRAEMQKARDARDVEAFEAARLALQEVMARAVLEVYGEQAVERTLQAGASGIAALERRIEALGGGRGTEALAHLLREAGALLDRAREAAAAGDPVAALRLGAGVLDLLARA